MSAHRIILKKREGRSKARSVLLIEDDANDAYLLKQGFERAKVAATVTHVNDAEAAMRYLEGLGKRRHQPAELPGLILLDLKMPRVSGFDLLAWLKAHPKFSKVPVIVLSGSEHQEDKRKAVRMGAVSYEVKPMAFCELISLIENYKNRLTSNQSPRALSSLAAESALPFQVEN